MLIALLIAALRQQPIVPVLEVPIIATLAFDVRMQRVLSMNAKVTKTIAMGVTLQ